MQLKPLKRVQSPTAQPRNPEPKLLTLGTCSPKESVKKTSTSTPLSQRSSSTHRVFLPKSRQLDQFFNSPMHQSTQKRLPSPCRTFVPGQTQRQNDKKKGQRVEFLKFNLNKDYFDTEAPNDKQIPVGREFDQTGKFPNYRQNISNKEQLRLSKKSTRESSQDKSTPRLLTLRSQGDLTCRRLKSPKMTASAVDRMMSKNKFKMCQMGSLKSFEYTFGNY